MMLELTLHQFRNHQLVVSALWYTGSYCVSRIITPCIEDWCLRYFYCSSLTVQVQATNVQFSDQASADEGLRADSVWGNWSEAVILVRNSSLYDSLCQPIPPPGEKHTQTAAAAATVSGWLACVLSYGGLHLSCTESQKSQATKKHTVHVEASQVLQHAFTCTVVFCGLWFLALCCKTNEILCTVLTNFFILTVWHPKFVYNNGSIIIQLHSYSSC